MNGIIYIRVTQYQKHLIKDLLEDNGISVIYDETLDSKIVHIQYTTTHRDQFDQYVKVKDLGDAEFFCTLEFFTDIQKMINGDINFDDLNCKIEKDKIYLGRSELSILLHRNGEVLVKLPYSHTPIYKKE